MKLKYEEMTEMEFLQAWEPNRRRPEHEEPNLSLLRKHVDWVKEQDAKNKVDLNRNDHYWDQSNWGLMEIIKKEETVITCNTGCCLAGNVAIQDPDVTIILDACVEGQMMGVRTKDGKVYSVEQYAADRLGLNYEYNDIDLFDGENKVRHIESIAAGIALRAGEVL